MKMEEEDSQPASTRVFFSVCFLYRFSQLSWLRTLFVILTTLGLFPQAQAMFLGLDIPYVLTHPYSDFNKTQRNCSSSPSKQHAHLW